MAIAGQVLQVEGLAGTLVSIINRGGNPKLVNQKVVNEEKLDKDDISEIPLDVVISYDVTLSNQKTSNPTQMGVNINDHIFKDPDVIVVNFGTTDYKGTLARLRGLYDGISSGWRNYKSGDSLSKQMLDILITASERKTLFSINDGLHRYDNLSIDSINYVRDKKTHRSFIATVTLSSWIFVQAGNLDGSVASTPVPYDKTAYAKAIDNLSNIGKIVR
nr:MAG TPA: hypothetical protein [Bacteriophage sp.]